MRAWVKLLGIWYYDSRHALQRFGDRGLVTNIDLPCSNAQTHFLRGFFRERQIAPGDYHAIPVIFR